MKVITKGTGQSANVSYLASKNDSYQKSVEVGGRECTATVPPLSPPWLYLSEYALTKQHRTCCY